MEELNIDMNDSGREEKVSRYRDAVIKEKEKILDNQENKIEAGEKEKKNTDDKNGLKENTESNDNIEKDKIENDSFIKDENESEKNDKGKIEIVTDKNIATGVNKETGSDPIDIDLTIKNDPQIASKKPNFKPFNNQNQPKPSNTSNNNTSVKETKEIDKPPVQNDLTTKKDNFYDDFF